MNDLLNDSILNFLSRKESPEDIQKLREWLDADPAHREQLKQWLNVWDMAETLDNTEKYQPEDAYQRFIYRLEQDASLKADTSKIHQSKKSYLSTLLRIAAVFIISFSLGTISHIYYSKSPAKATTYVENIIPLGSKSEIKLPDGSIVWLNAGSKLRYPTDYGKTSRDIFLEGEGYFKVAKQTDKPFTVHTAMMKVRALGTEFNVKAYPDERVAETMLINGKVVIDKGDKPSTIEKSVELKPGQKFSVAAYMDSKPEEETDLQQEILTAPVIKQLPAVVANAEVSWKERNWRIEREELQSLAVKLERRYDVKIQVDDLLKNYRYSGTLKDESLEQVLTAMQLSSPILFEVKGKNVQIYVDLKKMK
ncbi:transmembrane sensor [Parabacteroides sp. PF5-5]|uniref:FecR family protein n=1 Tax=unclassified Parabacteroides TaxID=2649774 RepID=UPI002476F0A7|nr:MULTISPECIES: FecR family protein [unclassified Parabacteroides]MDH6303710.1 transmembrane sensor [Parabacteroides sp. PH5-39]MDH6314327.1 transmembrane sensor [Parabacteroides sp. PF5-13]MDH6318609.1 transmembrane sensor [Parabacteroides sp. PH5-13]MDH6322099.1 transmembrane sensor [Parabacteroides sp. PH5-8]MDH6325822.1 transmembrane sensor [Parabacteroides sp. PH5-41]